MNNDDTRSPSDKSVSDAYRAVADERVPEALDKRILTEARQATAASKGRRWPMFRPLAWAATIGLSLALLLEYSQTGLDIAAPDPAVLERAANLEALRGHAADGEEMDRQLDDAPGAVVPEPAGSTPAIKSEEDKLERVEQLDMMSGPAGRTELQEAELNPAPVAEILADDARSNRANVAEFRERRSAISKRLDSRVDRCDAEARATEAAWRDCIQGMIDDGRHDLALIEYRDFEEAYAGAEAFDWRR